MFERLQLYSSRKADEGPAVFLTFLYPAISRHFCEMMGGTVLVESEAGKGSTFTMKLPATVDEAIGTPTAK